MRILFGVIKFIKLTCELIEYNLELLVREDFKNYLKKNRQIKKCHSNEVILLANGPSLNSVIERIKKNDSFFCEKDFCVVNYIGESNIFEKIKPKYYVITDCQFYLESHANFSRAQKMFKKISVIDWEMDIYLQYKFKDKFNYKLFEKNKNIRFKIIHSPKYRGFKSLRNFYFKNGLGNGEYGTVILNAEYVMLNKEYDKLHLFGVDHNYFDNLCLDENNKLCLKETHYYDKSNVKIKPVNFPSVSSYLGCHTEIFIGHEVMNEYAKYLNAEIINHTKVSLIDAYKKTN